MKYDPKLSCHQSRHTSRQRYLWSEHWITTSQNIAEKVLSHWTTIHELDVEIIQQHRNVTPEADIMYINEIPFVITTSRSIHFCTAELIKNEKSMTIATAIKQVIQLYHRCGFKVQNLHGDGPLEQIRKHFADAGININVTGRNEHLPDN